MNTLLLCILLYCIILLVSPTRYLYFVPTIPVYPENTQEVLQVKQTMKEGGLYYHKLFLLTDPSVSFAFAKYVPESVSELDKMITSVEVTTPIYVLKYLINRARPHQVSEITPIPSTTADTPAYPSGHAYQAYYLAKRLGSKYPDRKTQLESLAEDCAMARVYAGLHYPSDNQFSKNLVDKLY
jgi:hypothetical protein